MKTIFSLLLLSFLVLITQSFQCDRRGYNNCTTYRSDTVLLNTTITNPALEYHLYDTIWFNSNISDTYSPMSGTPASFTRQTDLLYLSVQPYSINTSGSLPALQIANIEFNPVVREGLLQYPGYAGYIFQYKRQSPNNTLIAGLVAGRTGLYLLEINPGSYIYGPFTLFNPQDPCTIYNGISNLPANQQNLGYWGQLGVTALSTAINYGAHTVSIGMRNYLIVKIIP